MYRVSRYNSQKGSIWTSAQGEYWRCLVGFDSPRMWKASIEEYPTNALLWSENLTDYESYEDLVADYPEVPFVLMEAPNV